MTIVRLAEETRRTENYIRLSISDLNQTPCFHVHFARLDHGVRAVSGTENAARTIELQSPTEN
jgi:hypothetical protein